MLKALLLLLLSAASFCCTAQIATPSADSLAVPEDSNHVVSDISCTSLNNGAVMLRWKVAARTPDFFSIERSGDGKIFEAVGVLNNIRPADSYQWTDDAPRKGRSFYRLRYSFGNQQPMCSPNALCVMPGDVTLKFYPNPVDQILIVRSDLPVDVQITDGNGRPRITEARVQGLHTMNVSSLEKGIYIIRFSDKLTNVIFQEKLIKN